MNTKIALNLKKHYSINFSLPKRDIKKIRFIIIHYTGMKKESEAIKKLCDFKSKVSSHYFIKNNGKILNLVPDLYAAWHAGISNWKNNVSLNNQSIGIEIHNPGHLHGYKKFSKNQISSLTRLLNHLLKKYRIRKEDVLGHSDISPNRKKDPGEKFPWKLLSKKKLCHWHNLKEKKIQKFRKIKLSSSEEKNFFNNLYKIGYRNFTKLNLNKKNKHLIQAFQRRFRQELINGNIDKECFLISKALIK
tara:strand:+ start:1504 stop:2244 length:741 start_codon:yes stop_codon:yes gene_type:complete